MGGYLASSFTQTSNVSGILYDAEWRTALLPGSWTPIPDTGSDRTHSFSLSFGTVRKLFIRRKVTNP